MRTSQILISIYYIVGLVNAWPAGPPSARGSRPLLPPLPTPSSIPCHGEGGSSSSENVGHELFLPQEQQLLTRRSPSSICGGHGKCSIQECICDPCWSGQSCTEYVDLHQPRFLVNNLYRVITKDVKGALFRAEVTDDDLGLTCPLHGPGEAATCPCATVRFTLAPGGHAALFSVDNETGDVFLVAGATLLPGNEYHLTLEAHGLRVAGWRGQHPGHDIMRAVVYVSHEPPLESLLLGGVSGVEAEQTQQSLHKVSRLHTSWPFHKQQKRRKRQAKQGLAVDLLRISPALDDPLHYGTALQYKVLIRLPSGPWSQEVELDISSEQEQQISRIIPVLSLCNVRVSHVTHLIHSSRGPILEIKPQLKTHAEFNTMFVKAVFNFGVISMKENQELEDNSTRTTILNITKYEVNIEVTFEAVVCNTSARITSLPTTSTISQLQYIRVSLANGEAGAQAAVNISTALTVMSPEQELSVTEGTVNHGMAPHSPIELSWAVTPHSPSSDLVIQVWDVTPGTAQFRVGGLQYSIDDGFYCLAEAKAILTSIKCLRNNDKSISRLLAKLYIPVYTKQTDSSNKNAVITFKAWLIPFSTQLQEGKNITIETMISSGDSHWSSKQNIIIIEDEERINGKAISTTLPPTITVTSLSAINVPRGVPVLSEIALHLPKGIFNLTMILTSKTKGIKPISISIVDTHSSVDQSTLQDYQILRPDQTQLIFKPSELILNTMTTDRTIVVHISFVADESAEVGPAQAHFTMTATPSPLQLTFTILPSQAPIVTPDIAVVPYEDEKAFDEKGLLGFGIMLEIPGGSCTKDMRVEVNGHFTGLGDGQPILCATNFASADPGLPTLAMIAVDNAGDAGAVRELGPVCSAAILNSRPHQTATYRVIFHLTSPTNSTLDGEVRMSGRVWLGGSALWSGGVAVRVHRASTGQTQPSFNTNIIKITCPKRDNECIP